MFFHVHAQIKNIQHAIEKVLHACDLPRNFFFSQVRRTYVRTLYIPVLFPDMSRQDRVPDLIFI
jgi:hypothetical protein